MTLQAQVSGDPEHIMITIRRLYTGSNGDDPAHKQLHEAVLNLIEPAVYESVRAAILSGVLQSATVHWDGNTLKLRNKV